MKQACKAIKSGEIFYIESDNGKDVTLRNPMTGVVKTIKGTTLKRSYTILSTEELKMENINTTNTTEEKVPTAYKELLDCESKADFEAKVAGTCGDNFEDVAATEDIEVLKKMKSNAQLCFRENMQRYINTKDEYSRAKAMLEAHPEDLDCVKGFTSAEKALAKYTAKMATYYAKAEAASAKIAALTPVEEAPVEGATADAE